MKKYGAILFLLIIMVCLNGCLKKDDQVIHSVDPLLFGFEDGLVTVEMEGSSVGISFDHGLWDEHYGFYDFTEPEFFLAGPFPVTGLTSPIKEVCIDMVEAFDRNAYEFITPVVVFLMDDGTISLVMANPYTLEEDVTFQSQKLPWMKDIVALTRENDSAGEKTIYATDKDGLIYDLRIPFGYSNIFGWTLYCMSAEEMEEYYSLTLAEDESVVFEKYLEFHEVGETYSGTYKLQLAENPAGGLLRAGDISFDLESLDEGQEISGVYSTKITFRWEETVLHLNYSEGKGLVVYEDRPADSRLVFSTIWGGG